MRSDYQKVLQGLKEEQEEMVALLISWVNINSHSENCTGLQVMLNALKKSFESLGTQVEVLTLPPRKILNSKGDIVPSPLGACLRLKKHPNAPIQVFLGGHMDTVFSPSSTFQNAMRIDANILKGPGAADMKGGLVILLKSLQALESSPVAGKVGWTLLINPDEELGSPGSRALLHECAAQCQLGLVFEPSLPDGSFVSSRRGSANFTLVVKGKAAHVGRDFQTGKNAIHALATLIVKLEKLTNFEKGIFLNIGMIEGGQAVNIVPETAYCRLNLRATESKDFEEALEEIKELVEKSNQMEGFSLTLHSDTFTPPKPFDPSIQRLFQSLESCCKLLGQKMEYKPSGGTCDGARLYAEGLPNIDTLGVIGGDIHTINEYAVLPSLYQHAQLTTLFLMQLANPSILKEI